MRPGPCHVVSPFVPGPSKLEVAEMNTEPVSYATQHLGAHDTVSTGHVEAANRASN